MGCKSNFDDSKCTTCFGCVDLCKSGCWVSPSEAKLLLGICPDKLALDFWKDDGVLPYIEIVRPTLVGQAGGQAYYVYFRKSYAGCSFLSEKGTCSVSEMLGAIPWECRRFRATFRKGKLDNMAAQKIHCLAANLWDSEEGREVVRLWKAIHGHDDNWNALQAAEEEFDKMVGLVAQLMVAIGPPNPSDHIN